MKILVTGGCGYKGHVLVPKLLAAGYDVRVVDTQWFGNFHPEHPRLEVTLGDVNDLSTIEFDGVDAIIHLASIANDPCGDLNPKLTWETSCLATMRLADEAVRQGIRRFIYASSGSVYGVKSEDKVTEELSLEPVSEYNKTKMVSERVLLSYQSQMNVQIVRPATVCGVSPRMRLDVSVNMLTMQALTKGKITVFGGTQVRPNIHIDDICDLYLFLIQNPQHDGIFNAGFENLSILDIARRIKDRVPCDIVVTESNDPRSYRLDSTKLLNTGFVPQKSVQRAISDIIHSFEAGTLGDDARFYNLRWMTQNVLAEGMAV
ncbi:MAG: SDR family oxidoreductase [Alphaproteobacteria bacterium]|nr:SDR family oxidoreductase [Alphaproteobacteria bacterium]